MSGGDYFVVIAGFVTGIVMLTEAITYLRRGIYTKTFKGISRREYIHKSERPAVYWLNLIFHFSAGVAMLGLGFWFLQLNPTVDRWYRTVLTALHNSLL